MNYLRVLNFICGISFFLFGMNTMSSNLERKAGAKLKIIFNQITENKFIGLVIGIFITALIQSSSATTVMVIGFINSGLMTLSQSISIIMGANVGTTITGWILSLSQIKGVDIWLLFFKPDTFVPIFALIGIVMMFSKKEKNKTTGSILLGFSVLMYGMKLMSDSVLWLKNVKSFNELLVLFSNPLLGLLVGVVFTAVIQSSSASVGILQALAATGQVTYANSIPIILGQNIGTCITALISSVGVNKNAKRAALIHLLYNVIGSLFFIIVFVFIKYVLNPQFLWNKVDAVNIAAMHTGFSLTRVLIMFPAQGLLERIVNRIVKDNAEEQEFVELDDRLLQTPALAIEQCNKLVVSLSKKSIGAIQLALKIITNNNNSYKEEILKYEKKTDYYEDILGTYLIKLSANDLNINESMQVTELLKCMGDFERIADHAVNITVGFERNGIDMLDFPENTRKDVFVLIKAVGDICDMTLDAFVTNDIEKSYNIEPLEQVIDDLTEKIRLRHIKRMQNGMCSINVDFAINDLLTNLERVSDHCSNIAGCIIDSKENNLSTHLKLNTIKNSEEFKKKFESFFSKYSLVMELY